MEAAVLDRNLKFRVIFCLVLNFIWAETMEAYVIHRRRKEQVFTKQEWYNTESN